MEGKEIEEILKKIFITRNHLSRFDSGQDFIYVLIGG
jgi:hypothetical protein